ncbi:DUF397 domain-containing protein [Thermomonospora amylolytica]|uniref:DUF397 domain-containing protein n=1 Tax=Thermomonospora amylolytica TaxID=1411117 RepID=UPI000E6BCDC0|nr:DUF397 domain-containing protein [Thermomonospora amylolytica]
MTTPPVWRKSTHSTEGTSSQCVEVAQFPSHIGVRDSKAPESGHLRLSADSFAALLARVKRDEFRA